MTATQTSAVMRQWDTQWILNTTLWDNSEMLQMSCSRHQINSWTEEPFLLLKKSLTSPNLPGPMWKYPVYAHLYYISLVYLCLMLKFVWWSKNVWKICKNKQCKGQILFGIVAEVHVRVKVYDSVSCTAADICTHPSLCLGLSNCVFLLGCSSHR